MSSFEDYRRTPDAETMHWCTLCLHKTRMQPNIVLYGMFGQDHHHANVQCNRYFERLLSVVERLLRLVVMLQ